MTPSARLSELKIELPGVTAPVGSYVPGIRTGNLVLVSGQIPISDGKVTVAGKVGKDVTEFSVGDSPQKFGKPVARATFKKARTAQAADCKQPVRGRYVLVRILSEVNGKPWSSAAEIGVVGSKAK